mmetsp:Transcript_48825/g.152741  ORF Transcript_48825/g.152741 Transcript_48825/m.152741 type:complete len:742 (-) Transcript_48825:106-2331(-)
MQRELKDEEANREDLEEHAAVLLADEGHRLNHAAERLPNVHHGLPPPEVPLVPANQEAILTQILWKVNLVVHLPQPEVDADGEDNAPQRGTARGDPHQWLGTAARHGGLAEDQALLGGLAHPQAADRPDQGAADGHEDDEHADGLGDCALLPEEPEVDHVGAQAELLVAPGGEQPQHVVGGRPDAVDAGEVRADVLSAPSLHVLLHHHLEAVILHVFVEIERLQIELLVPAQLYVEHRITDGVADKDIRHRNQEPEHDVANLRLRLGGPKRLQVGGKACIEIVGVLRSREPINYILADAWLHETTDRPQPRLRGKASVVQGQRKRKQFRQPGVTGLDDVQVLPQDVRQDHAAYAHGHAVVHQLLAQHDEDGVLRPAEARDGKPGKEQQTEHAEGGDADRDEDIHQPVGAPEARRPTSGVRGQAREALSACVTFRAPFHLQARGGLEHAPLHLVLAAGPVAPHVHGVDGALADAPLPRAVGQARRAALDALEGVQGAELAVLGPPDALRADGAGLAVAHALCPGDPALLAEGAVGRADPAGVLPERTGHAGDPPCRAEARAGGAERTLRAPGPIREAPLRTGGTSGRPAGEGEAPQGAKLARVVDLVVPLTARNALLSSGAWLAGRLAVAGVAIEVAMCELASRTSFADPPEHRLVEGRHLGAEAARTVSAIAEGALRLVVVAASALGPRGGWVKEAHLRRRLDAQWCLHQGSDLHKRPIQHGLPILIEAYVAKDRRKLQGP